MFIKVYLSELAVFMFVNYEFTTFADVRKITNFSEQKWYNISVRNEGRKKLKLPSTKKSKLNLGGGHRQKEEQK